MGIISTYLAARWLAKRAERRREHELQARGARVQTGTRCHKCGDSLVLSVDWPHVDPRYWEDHLGGICSNCADTLRVVEVTWPAPDPRQARGTPGADGPHF